MEPTPSPLDNLKLAAPCHAKWADMSGDERARFCKLCSKHVYNLSDMSRAEAEALIREREGNLCVRFYKRADGTVITNNCPVGLRALRHRLRWLGAVVAAGIALVSAVLGSRGSSSAKVSFREWFVEPPKPAAASQPPQFYPEDGWMGTL